MVKLGIYLTTIEIVVFWKVAVATRLLKYFRKYFYIGANR